MRAIRFIRIIYRKFPILVTTNIVLLALVSLMDAVSTLAVAPVIDFLTHPDPHLFSPITQKVVRIMSFAGLPVTLVSLLALLVGLNVLRSGMAILSRYWTLKTRYAVLRDLMLGSFRDFFRARWYFFSSGNQGTLLNTFLHELTLLGDALGAIAVSFSGMLQMILYLIVPLYISWQITSISLFTALLLAWPFFLLGKVSYRWGKKNTATANEVSSVIQESLNSMKVILGFGSQNKSLDLLTRAFDNHQSTVLKVHTLIVAIPLTYYPLGILILAIALFAAQKLGTPLSETAVLLFSLLKIIPSVGQLTEQKNTLDRFFPSFEQIDNLRERAKQLVQITGKLSFVEFKKEILIQGLSFAYPRQEPVLQNINLSIPKGRMIALVGESGVGKSTLVDIIMGFNVPTQGSITLDNTPLHEFDIYSYRRRIGYVPQDSILFNMTIRDNLLWAKEDASNEEMRQACRLANADEFIENFPEGYDTIVGDRGVRLSGGQAQRVALARAILRQPELLILDEATSFLDSQSERLIQQAIENIAKKTTVIAVAHRLSTIKNANYIYVIRKGRIAEEGTYSELIQKNGHFSRMAQLQILETSNKGA
ncbi:MAG: ABC transporter ATP-binding protein [Elusimicrobia bacterium]|nr:ABC transporter ATP-binding protein [Elusimicrobiota bacterium]